MPPCDVSSSMWSYALNASTTSIELIALTTSNLQNLKRKPPTNWKIKKLKKASESNEHVDFEKYKLKTSLSHYIL